MLFFWAKKSKPVVLYTRTLYLETGKNMKWAETFVWCLLLIFKVVYQDHLTQLLPFTWDFVEKGQQLVWGQMGTAINIYFYSLLVSATCVNPLQLPPPPLPPDPPRKQNWHPIRLYLLCFGLKWCITNTLLHYKWIIFLISFWVPTAFKFKITDFFQTRLKNSQARLKPLLKLISTFLKEISLSLYQSNYKNSVYSLLTDRWWFSTCSDPFLMLTFVWL